MRAGRSTRLLLPVVAIAIAILTGCACCPEEPQEAVFPELSGPYLGQQPPGMEPELFAPGIISSGLATRDVAMTPEGDQLYFGVFLGNRGMIMETKIIADRWSEPRVASFSGRYNDLEPHIAPDGEHFYFLSSRPPEGQEEKPGWTYQDIWVMDRQGDGWSEPYNLGPPVNSDDAEYFPSVTADGTIYFTRGGARNAAIFRSRLVDGLYQEPERLPEQVNCGTSHFNAFIAPDESFIIVCVTGREDSLGGPDYYIVFRDPDDTWHEPVNMGEKINSPEGGEWSPYVSPDGKYLFFMSSRRGEPADASFAGRTLAELLDIHVGSQNGASDIYWVDARMIEELRPGG